MKSELWLIGKTSYKFVEEGMDLYEKRIKRYLPFETVTINPPKNAAAMNADILKAKEGELVLQKLKPTDYLVLLDERGKQFSSEAFAKHLEKGLNKSHTKFIMLIGGAYGFSDEVYARANEKISLSLMTVSHQLVRVILLEQFYRALSILNNEPYHHA
jgi:23S rRNA (pseudouridine1915-N3)-methyltransferase